MRCGVQERNVTERSIIGISVKEGNIMATAAKSARNHSRTACPTIGAGIAAAVEARLHSSGHQPLRQIHCEVIDGAIVLLGVVPSYYLKQLAQALTIGIDSQLIVENLLDVESQQTLSRSRKQVSS